MVLCYGSMSLELWPRAGRVGGWGLGCDAEMEKQAETRRFGPRNVRWHPPEKLQPTVAQMLSLVTCLAASFTAPTGLASHVAARAVVKAQIKVSDQTEPPHPVCLISRFPACRRTGKPSHEQDSSLVWQEGEAVPSVVFKTRVRTDEEGDNPFDWKDVTSEDYFKGKRVAIFSLPGAFTPTCSSTHLPGYQKAFEEMKELGVDAVYCLSVNDAFVMRKWGLDQGLVEDKEKTFTPDYWKDVQLCVCSIALSIARALPKLHAQPCAR